jgi:hypothetical protein
LRYIYEVLFDRLLGLTTRALCRKRCEAEAEIGLRRGKSVLVDRCNFDYQQRVTWIKLGTRLAPQGSKPDLA